MVHQRGLAGDSFRKPRLCPPEEGIGRRIKCLRDRGPIVRPARSRARLRNQITSSSAVGISAREGGGRNTRRQIQLLSLQSGTNVKAPESRAPLWLPGKRGVLGALENA